MGDWDFRIRAKYLITNFIAQSSEVIEVDVEARQNISKTNLAFHLDRRKHAEENMSNEQRRLHELNQQKGASSWLTAVPTSEHDFHLTK